MYITIAKAQSKSSKDLKAEKLKPQNLKTTAPQHFNNFERFKRARKDKKKDWRNRDQDRKVSKSFNPATKVNAAQTIELSQKKRDGHCLDKISRNFKKNICYNCNKKQHFTKFYLKPKNQFQAWRPSCCKWDL